MRANYRSLWAFAACLLLIGCDTNFSPGYLLNEARVLALRAEPAELRPEEAATFDALVFTPQADTEIEYDWSWCVLAGGPDTEFGCQVTPEALALALDPEGTEGITIDYNLGTSETATFDYPVSPVLLRALCTTPGAEPEETVIDETETDPETPAPVVLLCRDSLSIVISLTVRAADRELRTFRNFTLHFSQQATPNENPSVVALGITNAESHAITPGAAVLRAEIPEEATETFTVPVQASETEEPSQGVELEELYEGLAVSWFVTTGTLEEPITQIDSALITEPRDWTSLSENDWEIDASAQGTGEVIVVLRDTRGGIDWLRQQVEISR